MDRGTRYVSFWGVEHRVPFVRILSRTRFECFPLVYRDAQTQASWLALFSPLCLSSTLSNRLRSRIRKGKEERKSKGTVEKRYVSPVTQLDPRCTSKPRAIFSFPSSRKNRPQFLRLPTTCSKNHVQIESSFLLRPLTRLSSIVHLCVYHLVWGPPTGV